MARPMALVGITFLCTLTVVGVLGYNVAAAFVVFGFIGFVISMIIKETRRAAVIPAAFLTVTAACLCFCIATVTVYRPVAALAGKTVDVTAKIVDLPVSKYGKNYYEIKTQSINLNGAPQNVKIRLSSKDKLDADPYDTMNMKLRLYGFGSDNSTNYYKAKGIYLGAYSVGDITITPAKSKPPYYYILEIRQSILNTINELLPKEEGGLTNGILLGDTSGISDKTVQNFRDTGISHLLAVSGMHTSLLGICILKLLKHLKMPKIPASVISSGCVFAFMALTAFCPSIMRSGIMMIVYLAGLAFGKEADSLNSLGFSVFALTVFNPFAALDCGLLLSFAATLGLITFSDKISKFFSVYIAKIKNSYIKKGMSALNLNLAVTLAATVFTLPVIILTFREVSIVSPLSNILEVSAGTVVMICGGLAALFSKLWILSFLKYPLAFIAGIVSKYMIWCANLLASIPFAVAPANHAFVYLWLAGTLLLIAFALVLRKDKSLLRFVSLLSAIALLVGVISFQIFNRGVTRISVLDVGNGTAVAVTRNGHGMVIGCGGDYLSTRKTYTALRGQSAKNIDLMFLPGYDKTESNGASDLLKQVKADRLVVPNKSEKLKELNVKSNEIVVSKNCKAELWNDVIVKYNSSDNNSCLYLKIGDTDMLISCSPGTDFESLPENWKNSKILICRASPPNGYEVSKAKIFIVSNEEEQGNETARELMSEGKNAVATGGYGNIVIETRGDGNYRVKRES